MKRIKKYSSSFLLTLVFLGIAIIAITQSYKEKQPERIEQKVPDAPNDLETATNEDPWLEVEKVVNAYYKKGGITYEGRIKVIDDNQEKEVVLEETDFQYTVYNNDFHYRLGDLEMISNADLLMAIDHTGKNISLSTQNKKPGNSQLFNLKDFKQTMLDKGASARVSKSEEKKILTFDNIQDPTIQGYRIYYEPGTYQISKIELGMLRLTPLETNEEEQINSNEEEESNLHGKENNEEDATEINGFTYSIEVVYSSIKQLGLADFEPEKKFINRQNNTIQLTTAFKEYSFSKAGE